MIVGLVIGAPIGIGLGILLARIMCRADGPACRLDAIDEPVLRTPCKRMTLRGRVHLRRGQR